MKEHIEQRIRQRLAEFIGRETEYWDFWGAIRIVEQQGKCLGNGKGGAHIHWHLFPRKTGDLGEYGNKGKGPAWWYPMEKMYADSERPDEEVLAKMKQQLLKELDKRL